MEKVLKILFVEDVMSDAELIFHEIEKNKISFTKVIVENKRDYLEKLKDYEPDLIISDYGLPQFDGMTALHLRNENSPDTPFILVTGSINEIVAVECMKAGADDYILKDNLSRLGSSIMNSIIKSRLAKEKKSAEEELRRSESRLQKAQSIAHVGNWELDLSTKIMWSSEEAMKIYGAYDESQKFQLSRAQKIVLPEYRAILDDALDRLLKYNEPYEVEFNIKRENDGALRSVFSKAELVLQEDGSKVKVIGVIQDITERKIAEKALSFNNLLLRTQQEASLDGILVVNEDDKIVNFNKKFVEFARIPREIVESGFDLPVRQYVAEQTTDPEEFINKVKHLNEFHEEISRDEVDFKDGRTYDRYSAPMFGPDKKYYGRVWYFRDITERKKSEYAMIMAKEKAEESDRLKTAFLHNISHEIRTPMNAIVGFSTLLGEPDTDLQSRKSYIDVIMQSSNHLLSIITDIVDISNIEANLVKTVKSELSVNSTLKSLCNQFLPKANEKKVKLEWETVLPDSDAVILTDRTKLTQVLSNLISNALKFTEKGSIKLSFRLKDAFLEFSVADTGIGIGSQFHERIFDRFFQIQNGVSRLYEGTGLGLAISKAYVELLGGKIWFSSEPGKGTTFFFTVPYEKAIPEIESVYEKKATDGFVFPQKRTILIAEDIESNFKLIKYFLAGSNTELIHAINGKEAVAKCLAEKNVDLILMDIKMPVMDGYTAVRLIREKNISIPIIAQTAYADDRDKAIECGCSGFISKPFDKKGLFKVLCEFL